MNTLPWIDAALAEIGQREVAGRADNPRIIEYLATVGLGTGAMAHDETAWCAAYINWCLKKGGIKGTGSAMALSYATWGQKLKAPAYGAIGYKKRFDAAGKQVGGHVFFIVGWDEKNVYALGGNQGNSVCVVPILRKDVAGYCYPPGLTQPVMPPSLAWKGASARAGSEA